jgi:glycerophosphoryl diester phosphodiesterase
MKRATKLFSYVMMITLLSSTFFSFPLASRASAQTDGGKTLEVRKTLNAPVIDGLLDDAVWHLDQTMGVHVGGAPGQAPAFGLLWDNQYLYVGVKVADTTPASDKAGYWFEQDNINFFFDPTLHRSAPFADDDMQVGFVFDPSSSTPKFHFGAALNNHSAKDEKRILRAIHSTGDGWTLEAAVPWDMLNMDPQLTKQLGFEIGATDRFGEDAAQARSSFWSANGTTSFWNDTRGYGTLVLGDANPQTAATNSVLLEESFDETADGSLPYGWISSVNSGSAPFSVTQDTYGNGRLTFSGSSSGKQARVVAPVQWDNYTIEADVRFESVLDSGRWASVMFRGSSQGSQPYNQMAIRQRGTFELAYRKTDNNWVVMENGEWRPLDLNGDYTMKVRVFGNNVKEYIKAKSDPDYTLLLDKSLTANLLERGKVGFQADQSKVSFDNLKVTRITADRLDLSVPSSVEALTGPMSVTGAVYYSDGLAEPVDPGQLKLYSSDDTVIKIMNNQAYPVQAGNATIKAVYANAEATAAVAVAPSATGAQVVALKHGAGYELAETGKPVDLAELAFQTELSDFTSGTLSGDQLEWVPDNDALEFSNGRMEALRKGVHTVTVRKDNATLTLLVVAKDAGDAEYVLYEENFDAAADGSMPAGWTRIEGATPTAAAVKSGAFEMNASASPDNPSRVLLPEYLGLFGDYKIEADVTHLAANDAARWHSIMYRIQNNNFPYYQMAVRKDAASANGVEFAERTPGNAWNVMDRGSHSEAIDAGKMYRYTVKAYGNRVQELIDNRLVVNTDAASAYAKGRIGLQANGSKMKVDNVRVTLLQEPLPPMPADRFVTVSEPTTKISMAPSIVTDIESAEQLAGLNADALPATVVLHVDDELNWTDSTGLRRIGTLDAALAAIGTRMIPAFEVKTAQAADRLAEYALTNEIEDAFVLASDGELVKRARQAYPMLRGIVDFSRMPGITKERLLDIRRQTTTGLAKIAILPENAATLENVTYLQQRLIVAWAKQSADSKGKSLAMHKLIMAEVNGIVTDSPKTAYDALKLYSNETTLIRKPYIIGHRGIPSEAPENTIESNKLSIDYGADFIENDIYVTKDDRLVIIHDSVLQNTTNGRGNVEDYTLAELKQLNANVSGRYPQYGELRIPTLDEQIDLARERGVMIYAEIKTTNPRAVDVLVRLIKEKDAEDVMNVMAFLPDQLKRFAELMPEMPIGLLANGFPTEANVNKALRDTQRMTQSLNATYNPGYFDMGKKYFEATKHRGIIVSPWTINDLNAYKTFFGYGAYAITTDYAAWSKDWAYSLQADKSEYSMKQGETLALSATAQLFGRDEVVDDGAPAGYVQATKAVTPVIVLLDGQDVVQVNGNSVTAVKPGTAHALLRYTASMDETNKYDLYTQPLTIEVKREGGDSGNGNGGGSGNGNGSGSGSGGNNGSNGGLESDTAALASTGGQVDAEALKQAFASASTVIVTSAEDTVEVAAGALPLGTGANGKTLVIEAGNAAYRYPVSAMNIQEWARQMGVNENEVSIRFTLKKLSGSELEAVRSAIGAAGGKLASDVYRFEVSAVGSNGKSVPAAKGTATIVAAGSLDPAKATGVQLASPSQQIRFVPTAFALANGRTTALFNRDGNHVFAIVESGKSFDDLVGHWARADVERLASLFLVNGVSEKRFDANRSISRAEFATLLARALGLTADSEGSGFRDVPADAWYAGDVNAAAAAGLLTGQSDGTFRPERTITRQEQAVMLMRALAYSGIETKVSESEQTRLLAPFKDAASLGWARSDIAAAVGAGLMNGTSGGLLEAEGTATRAQAAVMLKRFLVKAGLLD